jgi:putative Holliday junction resolvase
MTDSNEITRLIGIDYGVARIGIACSDERKIIASPVETIHVDKRAKQTVGQVVAFLEEHKQRFNYRIEKIIVGLPLMMSGKTGLMADEVKNFIELLKARLPDIPVIAWDERLTTVLAERSMREASMRRKKRSTHVDKVAAVLILQSYLDHLHISNGDA